MTKLIKLLSKVDNTTVLGVQRLEKPMYVKFQQRNACIINCTEKEAQGVMTADERHICQLDNKPVMESDEVKFIASFISEAEYDELVVELADPPEELPAELPEEERSGKMTAPEMRERILELEAIVKGGAMAVNDEATQNFMATLSSSETNSIAKIRAAAQQYLEDTASADE